MCIRGVRYDFVIFYKENSGDEKSIHAMVMDEIVRAGCEGFLSWACGIFLVNEGTLSPEERFGFEVYATLVFDLSCSPFALASENARAIPISAEVESLLKAEITTIPNVKEKLIQKSQSKVYLLSSRNFGTVLTESSLGFTFFRDELLGKLTPHTGELGMEDRGERLILRVYGAFDEKRYRDYDLCAVSSRVEYTDSSVRYHGVIDDVLFSVNVLLSEKYDVKKSEITLESEKSLRVTLIYLVSPALGEKNEQSRFYRFRKEKDCIRIVRLTDYDMRNGELIVFSPDATTMYTDTAAFRSDGMLFRGESDAAILFSRMELCGRRVVRCYLSLVFAEASERTLGKLADF